MTTITETFALCTQPVYMHLRDAASAKTMLWTRQSTRGKKYRVSDSKTYPEFDTEGEAWNYANSMYPDLIGTLSRSDMANYRACGLRGELFLTLGETRVKEWTEAVHQQVFEIYEEALRALDATRTTKAVPKVTRVSSARSTSWLEVRTKVLLPGTSEALLLSVRCFPSMVEDKTWSVRLRVPSISNQCTLDVQRRFEDLVTNLGYQGITVKDVQNGTCFDL